MMEWSLSELYPSFDSPEFQGDLKELENRVKEFNDWSQRTLKDYTDPVSKAEAGIKHTMAIAELYEKLGAFAQLTISVEAYNEQAAKAADRVHTVVADMALGDTRFKKWLAGLGNLDEVIGKSELLKEHEYFIKDSVRYARRLLASKRKSS